MPISALPQATVRLLGGSAAISNPLSLVKELIDNGIDAKATTIEIAISADTISKIQVRDNDQGINLDDFDSLGRRAHTSKLRTFEELRTKGGKTLGFRGEALASANTLAQITVTTRTVKDPVASRLSLKFGVGGVGEKRPVSGTVGTTVQASKLFEALPVRKLNAVKDSRKAMQMIKKLLQGYALALPHIKLGLKVFDDPSQKWSYSPRLPTTHEAILQVFGASLATQCMEIETSLVSNLKGNSDGMAEVQLTSFLPKPDCELKILKDKGAFISVDGRPISSTRGTGRKISVIFKKSWTQARNSAKSAQSLPNPFMHLSITCSAGSYDPNVSPMKDELLFVDEQKLLDCFEALCKQAYDNVEPPMPAGTTDIEPAAGVLELSETNASVETPDLRQRGSSDDNEQDEIIEGSQLDEGELRQLFQPAEPGEAERPGPASEIVRQLQQKRPNLAVRSNAEAKDKPTRNEKTQSHKKAPVEVMMRIVRKVDLSRNDSNASDEATVTGSLPVHVIPRSPISTPIQKTRASGVRVHGTSSHRFEDIGFYFQPQTENAIEIATDETATTGNTPEPEQMISETNGVIRTPLGELRDNDLNKLREEVEMDIEMSSPEPEILQPRNSLRGDLDAPFHRRDPNVPSNHESEPGNRRIGSFSPPSTPYGPNIVRQGRARDVYERSTGAREQTSLHTPPASNQDRSQRRLNPPFRPPRSSNVGTSQPSPVHDGTRQRALPAVFTMGDERQRKSLPFGRSSPQGGPHDDRLRLEKDMEGPKQVNPLLGGHSAPHGQGQG